MLIGADASRSSASQRTGTEAYSFYLLNALAKAAVDRDHRIRFYHREPTDEDLYQDVDGIEHVVIPFPRMWTHVKLAWELHRRPPDVFFTPSHVIPFTYRRPSVATVHDLGFLHFPETHTRNQLRYLRWSTRHNAKRSRVIIVDSQATKEDLVQLYAVQPDRIEVVYPGVDPDLRPVTDKKELDAVCAKYGVRAPYLLYIGTIQPRKNLVRLIDGFLGVDLIHQLVLAGKQGWLSESICDHIDGLKKVERERIVLTGFVQTEDKAALISGAEALVLPSLYEGFGFPVVEANAIGTPVLCSNTSSLPEIAGEAAILVDPQDVSAIREGIARLVADESFRKQLIQAGLDNSRRFSWETAAEQTLTILERAAKQQPSLLG
ncbi:MAG: glycosyltransferase family 4 protein [Candidatus Promineifilaceae bacterium]